MLELATLWYTYFVALITLTFQIRNFWPIQSSLYGSRNVMQMSVCIFHMDKCLLQMRLRKSSYERSFSNDIQIESIHKTYLKGSQNTLIF